MLLFLPTFKYLLQKYEIHCGYWRIGKILHFLKQWLFKLFLAVEDTGMLQFCFEMCSKTTPILR